MRHQLQFLLPPGSLLLACLMTAGAVPLHAAEMVISYAEKPAQLIRATTLFSVTAGTALRPGDIVQSGPAGLQIEGPSALTFALGPDSKIYLGRTGAVDDISLLSGWIKLQPGLHDQAPPARLTAGALRLDPVAATSVIHVDGEVTEIFVENGQQAVLEVGKRSASSSKLDIGREQYAVRRDEQALALAARPAKSFVGAMPRQFFDMLVPVANKLGKQAGKTAAPAIKKERDVTYDDVAPWLVSNVGLSKNMLANRFAPRLADPQFRQQVSDELGGNAEWRAWLDNPNSRKTTVKNILF